MSHIAVLPKEVLEYLDPKPGENFVDGTVGQGGHTILILQKNEPGGKVLGIDVLDHIIVTRDSFFSFHEKNILQNHEEK